MKRVQRKKKADLVTKSKENKSKDPRIYCKILKERNVSKDNTSFTLQNFYDHLKNLSQQNSVDEYMMKPENYTLELREIHIVNDRVTENEELRAAGKLKNDKAPGFDNIVN